MKEALEAARLALARARNLAKQNRDRQLYEMLQNQIDEIDKVLSLYNVDETVKTGIV